MLTFFYKKYKHNYNSYIMVTQKGALKRPTVNQENAHCWV